MMYASVNGAQRAIGLYAGVDGAVRRLDQDTGGVELVDVNVVTSYSSGWRSADFRYAGESDYYFTGDAFPYPDYPRAIKVRKGSIMAFWGWDVNGSSPKYNCPYKYDAISGTSPPVTLVWIDGPGTIDIYV